MLSRGELAREHVKIIVKSIDAGGTGKVGLRELVTFVRARQGSGVGKVGKAAETQLRRCVHNLSHRSNLEQSTTAGASSLQSQYINGYHEPAAAAPATTVMVDDVLAQGR